MTDHEEQDAALLLLQQEHVELAMAIYGEYEYAGAAAGRSTGGSTAASLNVLDELPSKEAASINLYFELSSVFLHINNFVIVVYCF